MAQQPTSAATQLNRLFVALTLLALLGVTIQIYNGGLKQAVNNYYRYITAAPKVDTLPVALPAPLPAPKVVERIIYRNVLVAAPPTASQAAALRQGITADVVAALRREIPKLTPKPPRVTLTQKPMVLALRDSVNVTRKPGTNKLSLTTLKTGSFQDKWLSMSMVIRPGKNGRPDSSEVKYQLRNEYDVSAWVKRPKHRFWPFGKRRIYVSLTSRNPNAHDTGLESIPVKKATKKP
jgi:hypothetical protein